MDCKSVDKLSSTWVGTLHPVSLIQFSEQASHLQSESFAWRRTPLLEGSLRSNRPTSSDSLARFCLQLLWFDFPGGSGGKESAYNEGDLGSVLGQVDLLEKEMATHSSILAWKIPWMEEPGGLQSMGLQRVGHDWTTSLFFTVVWKLSLGSLLFFGLLHHAVQWERKCYRSHILKSKKKHALVHLGCYNKILETRWLINSRNLVLTVPGGEKSKIKPPTEFMVDEGSCPGS